MADGPLGEYVYCVMHADARPSLADVVGVDRGRPVDVVRHAGLAAVRGGVSLAEFGSEALQRNLNDLDWLARTARAHQAVLDRALAAGTIVPLRLCTVFADEARVRAMLEHEHDVLVDALARLQDRDEWGVKLIADVHRLQEAPVPDAEPTGRSYLERRGRERRAGDEARRTAWQAADEAHARLRERATAATLLPPQSHELSGRAGEMVLNGAYLVDRSRVQEFRAIADELGERQRPLGIALEVSGPWPPYNFVAP